MNNRKKDLEELLKSIDGAKRAEAPGFFYTRLHARMEKEMAVGLPLGLQWKTLLAAASLVVFLLLNIFILTTGKKGNIAGQGDYPSIETFANEYHLGTENVYE
jgi:hypothetical protein